VVRAPDLLYTGDTRIALYQGGAAMVRPELTVTGKELTAYLNDSGSDTSLNKAYADGAVKIVSTADKRSRTGTSDHAEYYTTDQKVILDRGNPLLVDSVKGQTRGQQLTWWANTDRLLVNGVENRPADSLLRKK
jgi:lipopolysaccharide export system protein LptA